MKYTALLALARTLVPLLTFAACGDDEDLSEAQRHGVGRACEEDRDCGDGVPPLECLPFKGGYCGLEDCASDRDCPSGSACVRHDGKNYCFLICRDKPECNPTRPPDSQANCSSNIEFTDDRRDVKACVPPS